MSHQVSVVLGSSVDDVGTIELQCESSSVDETSSTQQLGPLGWFARPRRPETVAGSEVSAEALGVRHAGAFQPLVYSDPRLRTVYPAPLEGTIGITAYGGGFLALEDTASRRTKARLIVPYGTKLLTLELDPDAETVTISHGDGGRIELSEDGRVLVRTSSAIYIEQTTTATRVVSSQPIVLDSPDVRLAGGGGRLARVGDIVMSTITPAAAGAILTGGPVSIAGQIASGSAVAQSG